MYFRKYCDINNLNINIDDIGEITELNKLYNVDKCVKKKKKITTARFVFNDKKNKKIKRINLNLLRYTPKYKFLINYSWPIYIIRM